MVIVLGLAVERIIDFQILAGFQKVSTQVLKDVVVHFVRYGLNIAPFGGFRTSRTMDC